MSGKQNFAVPAAEVLRTKLKKYGKLYRELTKENAVLEKKLDSVSRESVRKKLEIGQKLSELDELHALVESIPPEIVEAYRHRSAGMQKER